MQAFINRTTSLHCWCADRRRWKRKKEHLYCIDRYLSVDFLLTCSQMDSAVNSGRVWKKERALERFSLDSLLSHFRLEIALYCLTPIWRKRQKIEWRNESKYLRARAENKNKGIYEVSQPRRTTQKQMIANTRATLSGHQCIVALLFLVWWLPIPVYCPCDRFLLFLLSRNILSGSPMFCFSARIRRALIFSRVKHLSRASNRIDSVFASVRVQKNSSVQRVRRFHFRCWHSALKRRKWEGLKRQTPNSRQCNLEKIAFLLYSPLIIDYGPSR